MPFNLLQVTDAVGVNGIHPVRVGTLFFCKALIRFYSQVLSRFSLLQFMLNVQLC